MIRCVLLTAENLALACQGCNNYKYNRVYGTDSVTSEAVPLYHPRTDNWVIHFAWNDRCDLLIGLTSTGRATIVALELNRYHRLTRSFL